MDESSEELNIKVSELIDPNPGSELQISYQDLIKREIVIKEPSGDDAGPEVFKRLINFLSETFSPDNPEVNIIDPDNPEVNIIDPDNPEVNIIDDPQKLEIKIGEEINNEKESLEITEEELVSFAVSAQENMASANVFFDSARNILEEVIEDEGYPDRLDDGPPRNFQTEWLYPHEINLLADRWNLPVAFMRLEEEAHYVLALGEPESHQGSHRVLVYDPREGGEKYLDLPNWDGNWGRVGFANKQAREQMDSGQYDLSILRDFAFTEMPEEVANAKLTRIQFDGRNCGLAVLMMAGIRAGVQEGNSIFKFTGREELSKDTGLKIRTRQEILDEVDQLNDK